MEQSCMTKPCTDFALAIKLMTSKLTLFALYFIFRHYSLFFNSTKIISLMPHMRAVAAFKSRSAPE